jgi:hypothetical protein
LLQLFEVFMAGLHSQGLLPPGSQAAGKRRIFCIICSREAISSSCFSGFFNDHERCRGGIFDNFRLMKRSTVT